MAQAVGHALWLLVGAALLLLPALPVPHWVQAPDPGPNWAPYVQSWLIGLPTVVVIGGLGGRLLRRARFPRVSWSIWIEWGLVVTLAAATTIGAACIAHYAMATNPQLIDEVAQLFQSRILLSGALAAPAPAPAEAFLFAHTWITPAGWVQQFPPAHAVWLAAGMAAHLEWLVNPLFGGVSTILVYALARGWYGRPTGLLAAFLWALAAWVLFMSATYMNHASAVAWALLAWVLVWGTPRPGRLHALGCGLAIGFVAATRPLDAVAVALPVTWWLLAGQRWKELGWMVAGGLPILAGLAAVNTHLYGGPFTFGYTALYGAEHGLGFHPDVYGAAYTPLVALANMAVAVRRLHIYLFEWPVPSALLVGVWAAVAAHRHPSDRWLLLAIAGGPALYFFYWHSGFYPGPRFYYVAAPGLIIGTARAGIWAWRRIRRWREDWIRWDRAAATMAVTLVVWGFASLLSRVDEYRADRPALKHHPERELAERGVDEALVLVPDSWGSRVIVGLWAAGVKPGAVERAYRRLDTCDLYELVAAGRRDSLAASTITQRLDRMMARARESVPLLRDWPDPTVRLKPRAALPGDCQRELLRDQEGFHVYGSLAWRNAPDLASGIVFARDLLDRNDELFEHYSGWPVWRYAPPPGQQSAGPMLTLIRPAEREGS